MIRPFAALSLVVLLASCGGDAQGSGGPGATSGKDRGDASMQLGDATWTAESAKAAVDGAKLTIRATRMDMQDGKVARQELHLQISDYKGLGDYSTGLTGSRFLAVGFDTKSAEAAQGAEDAAKKALTDVLSQAKHLMLTNAKVTVTKADATQISGTFSWQPAAGSQQPAITKGTFRALVDG